MKYNTVEANTLVKRLCRDTASDIVAGRVKFAEEQQVKWTMHYNRVQTGLRVLVNRKLKLCRPDFFSCTMTTRYFELFNLDQFFE